MKYFKFFSTCIITQGKNRSIICDLQRSKIELIPNDLYEIIKKLNDKYSILKLLNEYGKKNKYTVLNYLKFLEDNEYGFYCNYYEFERFPKLNQDYKSSSIITNVVIELLTKKFEHLNNIISEVENLGCKEVSIILYEAIDINCFFDIFKVFENTKITSFEITCRYKNEYNEDFIKKINNKKNQLTQLTFFSAPVNKIQQWDDKILFDRVYSTKNIKSFKSCGIIDSKYFNSNLPKVIESLNHNSCLNRKISIDINGNIKNCPAMKRKFGNIKDSSLRKAINHPDFKKYWNITKDQIEVCKDCEFRHVCTDCRAYIENPKDKFSKPLKCGYSPYTNKWEKWSTNPLKQKAIKYYDMKELVKKDA